MIKTFPCEEHMIEMSSCKQTTIEDLPLEDIIENGLSSTQKAENQSNNDPHTEMQSKIRPLAMMEIEQYEDPF